MERLMRCNDHQLSLLWYHKEPDHAPCHIHTTGRGGRTSYHQNEHMHFYLRGEITVVFG